MVAVSLDFKDEPSEMEKFLDYYSSLGIKLEPEIKDDHYIVMLEAQTHPQLIGYLGFFSEVVFDLEGRFMFQSFYE